MRTGPTCPRCGRDATRDEVDGVGFVPAGLWDDSPQDEGDV